MNRMILIMCEGELVSFFFFFFCFFLGHTQGMGEFPSQGANRSCSRWLMPQPQQ